MMKKILTATIFLLCSIHAFSQEYGNIEYMGKEFSITTDFFQLLNKEYNQAYLPMKYRKVYYDLVDFLKHNTTVIHVDEAKRITWTYSTEFPPYPYCNECKASNANKKRSGYIMYYILLPVIERNIK